MATHAGTNPYSAPQARVDDVAENEHAEKIRRDYLKHEAGVRSAGTLYGLASISSFLAAVMYLAIPFIGTGKGEFTAGVSIGAAVVFGILAWLFFKLARGLRALKKWTRTPTAIVSGIGCVIGFPLGTLIHGYIIWLVLSKKGTYVLSPEYEEIVAATPHIKQKTSILVWIFLVLIIGIVLAVAIPAFMKH
jgi:hypothetical protein